MTPGQKGAYVSPDGLQSAVRRRNAGAAALQGTPHTIPRTSAMLSGIIRCNHE
jgi:hypothetical protein